MEHEHIGETIRYHRGRLGITQEELARRAEMAPTSIVRLENGEIRRPRMSTIDKLAGALQIPVSELARFVSVINRPSSLGKKPRAGGGGGGGEPFTAVFEKGEQGWWVATCPEIPEAITQGRTIEEARENLKDAIRLELEIRREEAEEDLAGHEVIRERIAL